MTPAPSAPEPPKTEVPASEKSDDPASTAPLPSLKVSDPAAAAAEGKKKKKNKGAAAGQQVVLSGGGQIGFKGRVFALAELASRRRDRILPGPGGTARTERERFESLDLSIRSARFGIEYEAPLPWISATIEIDAADNVELKDGFVQARGKNFFARAGQFKIPGSAIELESPWRLPLARRGFVNSLISDWLDVAGRRPGFVAGVRAKEPFKPRLTLGIFQGETQTGFNANDRDTDLIEEVSLEAQSYVARAQIEVEKVEIGVWYQHRLGSSGANTTDHYFTTGADVVIDRLFPGGGLRAWLDAMAGASWYVHPERVDEGDATFVVARALVGYRFGGTLPDAPYVEPFGYIALLEPDLRTSRDFAWEGALGVNVGYWERARITVQAEINQDQRNFPNDSSGYLAGYDPDRLGLLLQAGVSF
jgi:hypothetical protein